MGGTQPVPVEVEMVEEMEKEENDMAVAKRLMDRIEEKIREIGLDVNVFRDLATKEFGLDTEDDIDFKEKLQEIDDFISQKEEKLKELAEALKTLEDIKTRTFPEEVENAMKEEGVVISLKDEDIDKLKHFVGWYRTPKAVFSMPADTLRKIFNAMQIVANESRLHITNDGLRAVVVDPANVMMTELEIEPWAMITYRIDKERVVGVDWDRLHEYCKKIFKGGDVTIEISNEIVMYPESDDGTRKVRVLLIDPTSIRKEPKVPSLEFDAEVKVTGLNKIVSAHSMFGDHMVIEVKDGEAKFKTEGDIDGIEDTLPYGWGEARAMYSMEYLVEIAKGLLLFDEVTIKFKTNYPAVFEGEKDGIRIRHTLAPRIEAE